MLQRLIGCYENGPRAVKVYELITDIPCEIIIEYYENNTFLGESRFDIEDNDFEWKWDYEQFLEHGLESGKHPDYNPGFEVPFGPF